MAELRDVEVLILPGLGGSGAVHWQTHWEAAFPEFRRVPLPTPDRPVYAEWAAALSAAVLAAEKPVVLVAHSLGTALVNRWRHERPELSARVAGAFLVAVTDIDRFEHLPDAPMTGFAPVLLEPMPFPVTVIASHNDERVFLERAIAFAEAWGAHLIDAGHLGHMGSAAALGVWPRGLVWFGSFLAEL